MKDLVVAIGMGYRASTQLFFGALALWLVPAIFELLQHVVEWKLGMFSVGDRVEPGFETHMRMGFGYMKVGAIALCVYFVPRFFYQGRNWRQILSIDATFLRGAVVVLGTFGVSLSVAVGGNWIVSVVLTGESVPQQLLGQILGLLMSIPLMAVIPWGVGLIAGDSSITLRRSIDAMHGRWLWAFVLFISCIFPAMILHMYLNVIARGADPGPLGLVLLLDSVVVGCIAILMGSAYWTIYRIRVLEFK